ncbi:MAG: ABC transporter ATP-binding protein [Desulfobacteraceae bacterium]|uniref:ABC transporter ATP-binding protein n=1 Tax=Candidatus Desulfacyla euxinica TaxID=2841693 RepID=A0A8J6T4J7_9DELT|nr:ABC transporter ATP-binding protein [Candidatus Desulfacyla euxinica]MBL6979031.1 ABC transporter ATP-binding protein [Desulfobacteraceae bacterium]
MPEILKVNNLSKSFGKVRAVHDLSFKVDQGEILGIIGPNGAGKTTLFNLISGEIKPDAGEVIFNGKDVAITQTFKKCRMGIARTYQIPRPFLNMTILENLLVGSIYGAGKSYKESKKQCVRILEKTGLSAKSGALVGTLPLLDRKRLELAKALATNPVLLLVDEVAGGLTEGEVEEFLRIIHGVRKEGVTVLWVEHIVMAMTKGPDRLLVMNFGRRLFVGRPDEAFNSPDVQKIYLGDED